MNLEKLKYPIGIFEKPISITASDIKNWIATIEQFPNRIKKISKNLSEEELHYTYRPNGWMIKQVIHHCADSHMNSFIRFKLALTEESPIIKPYEEAKWAELIDSLDNNIEASLQIIDGVHYRWSMVLKNLNKEQLSKQFINPESKKTFQLDETIGLYAWHCEHHLAHIMQALFNKNEFNIEN